jgi:hypothetical protein
MATTAGSSVALRAIVTGDAPSEKLPSFRYSMMVEDHAQMWRFFEGRIS